tara:strand:- start:161 stop:382 length:222 start_codon:yes stop_codon:yes gene_type:complete
VLLVEVLLLLRVLEDGGRGGNAHGEEGDDVLEADIYLNDRTIRDNDYVYLDVMSKEQSFEILRRRTGVGTART